MGTRHIIAVKEDGKFKVFNYGQWDGYPEGQGVTVLDFLQKMDLSVFREHLNKIHFVTEEEYHQWWSDIGVDLNKCNGFVNSTDSDKFYEDKPQLSRDMGANILTYILETESPVLMPCNLGNGFAGTWCEWFYVIDLDQMKLSVFDSYIFEDERDIDIENENVEIDESTLIYLESKARATFNLEDLPTKDDFINNFCNKDDE